MISIEYIFTASYDYGDHEEQITSHISAISITDAKHEVEKLCRNADWISIKTWENDLKKFGGTNYNL